ncbi:D-alanyl-D-alanine carboxypeptidase [Listeria riparia FSL S10-1204]|uniref:D-alanyl-D-alanine carboxypeptidase n=1 Tax=Listeria riparia FSL S10-1204 TaxID=1265816 RepID=W7DCL9_9LIST|nr:D-alanyl-D-alanine carboxypeptidase family protein [Listeria riparia]EUJ45251.1 D-alanyl-D-alanine carboxypeptidase [Listeria riparia FSL S10-1204]
MKQLKDNLLLINNSHTLSKNYVPSSLVTLCADHQLTKQAAENIYALVTNIDAREDIVPVSGYRSYEEQSQIYQHSLTKNGKNYTQKYIAKPGSSEHQAGLAIDVALKQDDIDFICPEFPNYGIARIFREQMATFGFILRYPEGKTQITGIAYEPWHFRYVGLPHSQIIKEREYVLEEYIDYLRNFTSFYEPFHWQNSDYSYYIVTVPMEDWFLEKIQVPDKVVICEMSDNNCGELIITYRTD